MFDVQLTPAGVDNLLGLTPTPLTWKQREDGVATLWYSGLLLTVYRRRLWAWTFSIRDGNVVRYSGDTYSPDDVMGAAVACADEMLMDRVCDNC